MYLKDFLTGLRRRWYLALVGLLITGGLGFAVISLVPPSYTSTSSLLLLPPQQSARTNPLLNLGGLGQALEVLTTRINASPSAERIASQHPDAEIKAGPDATSTGPILLISVSADEPAVATEVRDQLKELAPQVLVTMQNELNIVPNSRITITTLATDTEPTRSIKDQVRALIAVVAIGVAGTILITGYLDYVLALRRRRADGTGEIAAESSAGVQLAERTEPGRPPRGSGAKTASNAEIDTAPGEDPGPTIARRDTAPSSSRPTGPDEDASSGPVAKPSWWDGPEPSSDSDTEATHDVGPQSKRT